jgi:hypothetical protein
MTRWQKAIVAGLAGSVAGAGLGALAAIGVAHDKLDFEFTAPGVFLLEVTGINTAVSHGASLPTTDYLVPANVTTFAAWMFIFTSLASLAPEVRRRRFARPVRLSLQSAASIVLLIAAMIHVLTLMGALLTIATIDRHVRYLSEGAEVACVATGVGLAITVTYWMSGVLYRGLRWRPVPDDAPYCRNCVYNLTGNESGICPECGSSVEQTETITCQDTCSQASALEITCRSSFYVLATCLAAILAMAVASDRGVDFLCLLILSTILAFVVGYGAIATEENST